MSWQNTKDTLVACVWGYAVAMALHFTGFPTWVAGWFK